MNPPRRIVPLGATSSRSDSKEEKLEQMLAAAVFDENANNQNGNGKKNTDKEVRARRRAQKIARKRNRLNK